MNQSLLEQLRELELELHHPGACCTRDRLEQLLHRDFHEVGRSGRRYDRETVIAFLAAQSQPPDTESTDFDLSLLGENCALLGFRSVHRMTDGNRLEHALRASVWVRSEAGWQLRYHQGTPSA